jgi:hypothetical protein
MIETMPVWLFGLSLAVLGGAPFLVSWFCYRRSVAQEREEREAARLHMAEWRARAVMPVQQQARYIRDAQNAGMSASKRPPSDYAPAPPHDYAADQLLNLAVFMSAVQPPALGHPWSGDGGQFSGGGASGSFDDAPSSSSGDTDVSPCTPDTSTDGSN